MKFKAPADTGSCNIGGQHYEVVDGILEVPDNGDYIGLLSSHGFTFISSDQVDDGCDDYGDQATTSIDASASGLTSETSGTDGSAKTVTKAEAKAKVKADKLAKAAASQG